MSASPQLQRSPVPAGPSESYVVAAEKLLAGNPRRYAWVHYASSDGRFSAGLWHSEVGKWRIHYAEDECCHIVEGISVVTSADGPALTLRPGDYFVIHEPLA